MPVRATADDLPATLKLMNSNDPAVIFITSFGLDDANIRLGFRMTPSSNQNIETTHRTKQINQLEARLNATIMNPTEALVI